MISPQPNTAEHKAPATYSKGQDITLDFYGPYSFSKAVNYLFYSPFVNSEGIYIWTIKDQVHSLNYVHYIGETISFGKRHREHFTHLMGLNYQILDPEAARQGIKQIIWNGMWRDRSPEAVATLLERSCELSQSVRGYAELLDIYFAPTQLESRVRKHLEGCLGRNLRGKYPDLKRFYPDDNHVGTMTQLLGQTLIVNLPEAIAGIDNEQCV